MDLVCVPHYQPIRWDIIITDIARVARDLWQCKQALIVLGLHPWTQFVYCHKSLALYYNYYIIL